MDSQTHLPLRRVFQWRDPVYNDKNTDAEEYDDYRPMDGFPTPFSITRFKNDEMVRQYYVTKVSFNQELPADFWNVDAADRRIKKWKRHTGRVSRQGSGRTGLFIIQTSAKRS